jgi:hypothetical protein
MFGRVSIAAVLLGALLSAPGTALAGAWPWPVAGRVGLGYAESWTDSSGRRCSHGGLDVEAPAGAPVSACVGGRVVFAGKVPATGGGTVLAVSVVTPDGLRVTYLPLAQAAVSAGTDIAAGERVGELAVSGDGSLATSHLHVSVRRGESPIDPATLLGALSPVGGPAPSAGPRPSDAPPAAAVPAVRTDAGPAAAPAAAGASIVPVAIGAAASAPAGPRAISRVPMGMGPRLDVRVRPLPYQPRLDVREAVARGGAVATAGRGLAIRVLLALLTALMLGRIGRAAMRVAADGSVPAPLRAHARRART